MPAAICAFVSHPGSFADAVSLAVSLGGDTNTIAAMTGALAGALLEEPAIPRQWVDRVEAAPQMRVLAHGLFAREQPHGAPVVTVGCTRPSVRRQRARRAAGA